MSRESARLFLALWPDAGVRAVLARHSAAWRWNPKAAVVPKENLHLTLHFIGNVPYKSLSLVKNNLWVPFGAFDLDFGHPEIWRRDIAILNPGALPENLLKLHAGLADSLQRLGLRVEVRSFQPHVTLARGAADSIPPAQEPAIRWHVAEYALVESRLAARAEYFVVEKYACQAA